MTIVGLIVTLIIVGVVLYLINLIPMDAIIKQVIYVLVILLVILYVLQCFGLIHTGIPLR